MRNFPHRQTPMLAGIALLALPLASRAIDYPAGDGSLSINGSIVVGTAIRSDAQDPALLPGANAARAGLAGTAPGGAAQDDGNLNFNRGDTVTTPVKAYLTLAYRSGDYGALVSAKMWYDYTLSHASRPWGNSANGYAANTPLSDRGADLHARFSGVARDLLYVYGRQQFESSVLDWTLGYQKLDWGKEVIALGGLRDLNPIDFPAEVRPGALRDDETRIAIPALVARLALPQQTSVEGFYQFQFQPSVLNQCGTLLAVADFVSPGCDKLVFQKSLSDPQSLAAGMVMKRADHAGVPDAGQAGFALKHTVASWNTEFGAYVAQFHSRTPYISATKSQRTAGPLFVPNDPGNLNPKYFTEYPEDIRMVGLSFETKMKGGSVYGEFTYRPNQALQYNVGDLLNAVLSPTAPTPLRAQVSTLAPGAALQGWERHRAFQAQLAGNLRIPDVLGSAALGVSAAAIFKSIPDLPEPTLMRFGRSDVFGIGPVNGVCPPAATSPQCSLDGYVSRQAYGYRLRAGLLYANAVGNIDLTPALFFAHDVSGWAGDGSILQGRKAAIVSLAADFKNGWGGQIAWQPTWGGTYNNIRDRSVVQANIGYKF